jgi:hypothetical protein
MPIGNLLTKIYNKSKTNFPFFSSEDYFLMDYVKKINLQ